MIGHMMSFVYRMHSYSATHAIPRSRHPLTHREDRVLQATRRRPRIVSTCELERVSPDGAMGLN
jgi:hypothetical protein